MASIIEAIEKEQLRDDRPASDAGGFRAGDTLKVHVKVVEGGKERIQVFEGICIDRKHDGVRESFTVRKISHTVGVERTFMLHSPKIDRIDVVRRGKVRRAKLFYLRKKIGKAARLKELR